MAAVDLRRLNSIVFRVVRAVPTPALPARWRGLFARALDRPPHSLSHGFSRMHPRDPGELRRPPRLHRKRDEGRRHADLQVKPNEIGAGVLRAEGQVHPRGQALRLRGEQDRQWSCRAAEGDCSLRAEGSLALLASPWRVRRPAAPDPPVRRLCPRVRLASRDDDYASSGI